MCNTLRRPGEVLHMDAPDGLPDVSRVVSEVCPCCGVALEVYDPDHMRVARIIHSLARCWEPLP